MKNMGLFERMIGRVHLAAFVLILLTFLSARFPAQSDAGTSDNRYGPFNTRVTSGSSPKHGSSPFEEINRGSLAPKKHEHHKGRVMIKLSPPAVIAAMKTASSANTTDDDVLAKVRSVHGFKGMKRHFKQAKAPAKDEMIKTRDGKMIRKPDLTRWHRIDIDENEDVFAKVEELKQIPGIEVAEPDYVRKPAVLPGSATDPLYDQQWYLAAVKAPQAWAYLQAQGLPPGGTRDVVVAVIDTGIDLNHPDLAANLWTAQDGSHGRDVITDTNNPMDDHGHGTHVAGIIAAQANNAAGGVGIAYNVQIMAIKAAQYSGVLSASDIAEGIYFAVANGADVINMSFGGYGKSQIEEDALAVAFGQAVLVAAAGNDGLANDKACGDNAKVMYPAGYNWVLGVMASNSTPNAKGDYLASFSNYDCIPNDTNEYEIMAPGAGIWSTLPNNQYAAWSGTSMATPVVAGIAALVRTKFPDKDSYSSRFIMGQLATTGAMQQAYTPDKGDPVSFHVPDAYAALTTLPKPQLSYLEHWLFDTTTQSATNNNNGRVDAGETIDLAVNIRNQWGKADNVTVKLEAVAGVVGPDPYVTMIADTVNYGAVGSFSSDDNGLTRDATGAVTGVANPFRFSVSPTTPNGHIIPFKVTITARNGFDAGDSTLYTTESKFNLTVTNGTELPRIISQDMVLTKDTLWIVPDATLIETGVTLTVREGTKIQFYSSVAKQPYSRDPHASILVKGKMELIGTCEEPIELYLSDQYKSRIIELSNSGEVKLSFVKVENPSISADSIDHGIFYGNGVQTYTSEIVNGQIVFFCWNNFVRASTIKQTIFNSVGTPYLRQNSTFPTDFNLQYNNILDESIFENSDIVLYVNQSNTKFSNNVLLNNKRRSSQTGAIVPSIYNVYNPQEDTSSTHNVFLDNYINLNPSTWSRVYGSGALANNYWGTASTKIIDTIIWDYNDDFNLAKIMYEPILSTAPETAYPFVDFVALSNSGGQPSSIVSSGATTFIVTFNRDMDQTIQPQVSFGPAEPYTDYSVRGGWRDARTWVGTFNINPITGDGYQIVRVAGARAANDPWLVTGDDSGRFQFEIITSGAESMNLQANGGEGYVDLSWTQNDFDLLGGYNVYRSSSSNGAFIRVNTTIIPPQTKTFRDTNVSPGQPYYYKFTVVKTDMSESAFSNVATGTPLDTVPPVINHMPLTSAAPGLTLPLTAQVTDNVGVKGVNLYFRAIGAAAFSSQAMVKTTGSTYSSTIAGSLMVSPGIEYYITATDGISTVNFGRPEYPYQVKVVDKSVITSVSPVKGPATGGTTVTIAGTNFKTGATVTFGGAIADNVTVVSSSQITCVTPAHFPTAVDIAVVNKDGQSGTLLRGFTYESDVASLSLPVLTAGQNAIVQVPVNAASISGLAAAALTIAFDPAVLRARTATTGTLTPGWSIAANTGTSGQIRVSMASPGSTVSGSGVVANLEFEVIGAPGGSSSMALSNAKLNDGAIPVTTADGTINVQVVYTVSGNTVLWKNGTAIPVVQLQLAGDRLYNAVSNATGSYTVSGIPPGSYSLRPSKTGDVNGITAYDASLVLQHTAGIITLSGSQATAADVDKSGEITPMDAFYILQKAADLITLPFPGAGVIWEFNPFTRVYGALNANLTGQDFTGILLGDVSGNWAGQETSVQDISPIDFRILEALPAADRTVTATASVNPQGQNVNSFDIVLTYDAAKGTPVSVEKGDAAQSWTIVSNLNKPGEIRVAMAGAMPITAEGTVLTLKFNLLGEAQAIGLQTKSVLIDEVSAPVQYMLAITRQGAGSGSITSITAGISCGSDCSKFYNSADTVTLNAVADPGSTFTGWSGACTGIEPCIVTMDVSKNVKASFADVTPPDVNLTSKPANPGNQKSGSIGFSSTDATTTFECKMDTGAFSACTSPYSYANLTDSSHTFTVQAKDPAGNISAIPAAFTWTIDTTPPDVTITAKPANPSNQKSGSFTFSSTDATANFECKLDAGAFAACTSPYSFANLVDASHTFTVQAKDPAGNISVPPAAYTWTIDTVPPDAAINAKPSNLSNQKSGSFTFSSTDATATFECKLDAGAFAACASPYTYADLSDDSHTFTVRAKDPAGNVTENPYSWTIDTTSPTLTLSTLADGAVTNNATLNVSGNVSDANGIKGLTINNVPVNPDVITGHFSYALPLLAGANTITTIVTDNADNQTNDTRTITLDQTAPVLTITAPADNSKIGKTFVDVTGTVDENSNVSVNGSTAGVIMNGMSFSSTVNLVSGLNTIDIIATDLADNTTSAKRTVTSDTEAPSLAVSDPAQDITTEQSSITISGTVSDTLTAVTITITADGQTYTPQVTNGGFTQAITLSAPNTYAVIVTATDEAGNKTPVQRNIIYVKTATGDINGDGEVTIADALMALRIAVGLVPMDNKYLTNGDVAPFVNGKPAPDGEITIADALIILRKSVGLINWLVGG